MKLPVLSFKLVLSKSMWEATMKLRGDNLIVDFLPVLCFWSLIPFGF